MYIDKMALLNFRNYQSLNLTSINKLNLFVGDNAQGKTNILEAIYYSGTVRSFRTNRDAELIKWNEGYFIIKVWGENQEGKFMLELGLNKDGRRKLRVNGVEKKKISDFFGVVKVVLFSPEDLALIKGGPVIRRKFLDNEICQLNPSYYYNLVNYTRILSQRNNLLKKLRVKKGDRSTLQIWDQQLVKLGSRLICKKVDIVKKLAPLTRLMHRRITNGLEELEIKYLSNVADKDSLGLEEIENIFSEKLIDNTQHDIDRGITSIGPHRDDLGFSINNKDMKVYGSQGQQRTGSLSLKLAELEMFKGETGEYPILLLDDVMSELDEDRRKYLLETVQPRIQTFITTTDFNNLLTKEQEKIKLFQVRKGSISS